MPVGHSNHVQVFFTVLNGKSRWAMDYKWWPWSTEAPSVCILSCFRVESLVWTSRVNVVFVFSEGKSWYLTQSGERKRQKKLSGARYSLVWCFSGGQVSLSHSQKSEKNLDKKRVNFQDFIFQARGLAGKVINGRSICPWNSLTTSRQERARLHLAPHWHSQDREREREREREIDRDYDYKVIHAALCCFMLLLAPRESCLMGVTMDEVCFQLKQNGLRLKVGGWKLKQVTISLNFIELWLRCFACWSRPLHNVHLCQFALATSGSRDLEGGKPFPSAKAQSIVSGIVTSWHRDIVTFRHEDAETGNSGYNHQLHSLRSLGYCTKGERWQFQITDSLLWCAESRAKIFDHFLPAAEASSSSVRQAARNKIRKLKRYHRNSINIAIMIFANVCVYSR